MAKAGKSPVGLLGSLKAHAKDETHEIVDFSKLPGGITNGVARLVAASYGEFKSGDYKGKPYVRLAATVLEPETASKIEKVWDVKSKSVVESTPEIVKVRGLQTSISFKLCDTERQVRGGGKETVPQDENVSEMQNMLRVLGGEEFTAPLEDCTTEEQAEDTLKELLQDLVKAAPLTKFSTSMMDPSANRKAMVFDRWYGPEGVEYTDNGKASGTTYAGKGAGKAPTAGPKPGTKGGKAEPEEPEPAAPPDVDELVAQAEAGDDGPLKEAAEQAGIDHGSVDTWAEVGSLLKEALAGGETTEPAEGEGEGGEGGDWLPAVEDTYKYHPLGKDKKPLKNAVEVDVTAVNTKNRTVDLKKSDDKKVVYKGISWDALESAE